MAGGFKVQLKTAKTIEDLRRVSEDAKARIARVVSDYAARVKRSAQARAPVDTGALRKSVMRRTSRDKLSAQVIAQAPHSVFAEFGTKQRQPHPFLVPSLEEVKEGFRRDVAAAINGAHQS
jgi:HK97 gp10 family phage protein